MPPLAWPMSDSLLAPDGLISGSGERITQIASSTSKPAMIM